MKVSVYLRIARISRGGRFGFFKGKAKPKKKPKKEKKDK